MRNRTPLIALATALMVALSAASASAGTPQQDLAWLNAKRVANGIPGGVTLNTDWSAKCAQHVGYMQATNTVTHPEDPANPNFSESGNWAGTNAVLAMTAPWTATNFFWEPAPLHLAQLLAPQLAQVGIADNEKFVCVTTWPGYQRPAPTTPTIVTYPGNGSTIYASETTDELPITPAATLGLANPTGPHLFVYAWGPDAANGMPLTVRSATLTGPSGPVALRWVDNANTSVGQFLPTSSAILIPVLPLEDRASYVATVTLTDGIRHAWGFTTEPAPSTYVVQDVRITTRSVNITGVQVRIRGRVTDRSTGEALVNVPITIRIGDRRVVSVTTRSDGSFDRLQTLSTCSAGDQSVIVTLRTAKSLTTAYATTPLPRRLSGCSKRSAARAT